MNLYNVIVGDDLLYGDMLLYDTGKSYLLYNYIIQFTSI